MRIPVPSQVRQNLLCALGLGLVALSAPFPRIQMVVHVCLVVALAPRIGAPLMAALWAVAAGWTLEGSLRLYAHFGGTAWADLTLVLLASWMAGRWPLENLKDWFTRLLGLTVLHLFLVHGAVRLAVGPHPYGWGWLWALVTIPAWGWIAWRLLYARQPEGRL
jgi:hypothetical protein